MNAAGLFDSFRHSDGGRIGGVVVGIVIDNQDPEQLGRVQVKLLGFSDDEIGHWARIAAPMAGANRGVFLLPEVNDEVLLAFEQGDLTRPYVLGGLWNLDDQPPETNDNGENNRRFIRSRSGHVIRLDDTDGSERIEIVDKSGNNQITIDTANNAIAIASEGDITLTAPRGTIKLEAQTIEIKSSADSKIEASAGMEVKASAKMTLQGATIDLN